MKKNTCTVPNSILFLGLLFLYIPLVLLIFYSFNHNQMVNVWGGFSLKWYNRLFHDNNILNAAWLSIRLALMAASLALALSLLIACILRRYTTFKGRFLLSALTFSPIVMPDIAAGLALLLMFVSIQLTFGWFNLGFTTMLIAHVSFCTAYTTIVLRSRLHAIDKSTEEAALDLGARPLKTFFWITLPQMIPSLMSAWLLSITLSIDDLVITSFVRGPSDTTLPIYIFSTIKTWVTPEINALATILILIVSVCVIGGIWAGSKLTRR